MNFSDMEQKAIWCYAASTLLLGNVEFDDSTLSDSIINLVLLIFR